MGLGREVKDLIDNNNDPTIANVEIITNGVTADITIDGHKLNGVIGYEIVHDRTKTQVPIVHLHLQSKLSINTGMIPELPEPWSYVYALRESKKVNL